MKVKCRDLDVECSSAEEFVLILATLAGHGLIEKSTAPTKPPTVLEPPVPEPPKPVPPVPDPPKLEPKKPEPPKPVPPKPPDWCKLRIDRYNEEKKACVPGMSKADIATLFEDLGIVTTPRGKGLQMEDPLTGFGSMAPKGLFSGSEASGHALAFARACLQKRIEFQEKQTENGLFAKGDFIHADGISHEHDE